jgi:flagellar protein FliS
MIVILYDILFAYMEEAKEEHEQNHYEAYKDAIKQSQKTLDMMMGALDFRYEVSKDLQKLYVTCKNLLAKAIYQNRLDGICEAEKILKNLYVGFTEAAKSDTSAPLMQNVQKVYAGMTYGRSSLNENLMNDNNRGFLV